MSGSKAYCLAHREGGVNNMCRHGKLYHPRLQILGITEVKAPMCRCCGADQLKDGAYRVVRGAFYCLSCVPREEK